MTSSRFGNVITLPETYAQSTLKYVVVYVRADIVYKAKFSAFNFSETLKCPLIVDVLSSIVCKKL
jgi:hypothetical protein